MSKTLKSLTVRELIDELEMMPDDAVVVLTSDYGDHCHTEQALRIDSVEELTILKRGAYSASGWVVNDEEPEEDDEPEDRPTLQVVALRTPMPSRW